MKPYARIRDHLLARRDELNTRMTRIHSKTVRSETPLAADFAEQAVEQQNDEVLRALEQAAREEIKKINRALSRIETGDYGICVECGEPIPEKRLEALPFTEYCVSCAEKLNRTR